jgi:hypothetical protein
MKSVLRLKLIACNVFQREICYCLARVPHVIDPEFIELGAHSNPGLLRRRIQERIDAAEESGTKYDAILLLYGLCGNAGAGLIARGAPLVMPRAHDCATVLLGSKARFAEVFGDNPSRPFSSVGYFERSGESYRSEGGVWDGSDTYEDYVERYGEDNARYLWETLHAPVSDGSALFIDIPETTSAEVAVLALRRLSECGLAARKVAGSLRLIESLLGGIWSDDDFVVIPVKGRTRGVYDHDRVIEAD